MSDREFWEYTWAVTWPEHKRWQKQEAEKMSKAIEKEIIRNERNRAKASADNA